MKFIIFALVFIEAIITIQSQFVCPSCADPPFGQDCTCPNTETRLLRKFACGPACDAIGYCCEPTTNQCPSCDDGVSRNSACICTDMSQFTRRKVACGPACDALGFCCDTSATTTKQTITTKKKKVLKCFYV